MDLSGKVALVTGGAKRVGKAIVLALAQRGCKLVVHYYTSQTEAEETVQRTPEAPGMRHSPFRLTLAAKQMLTG